MSTELNTYLDSLGQTELHFSSIVEKNRQKQEKVGQEAKKALLKIVGRFELPYYYSKFPTTPCLFELPDDTSEFDEKKYFRKGLVLEYEIYRKKSDRFDPMVVLERPGIYKIPVGKKGPDLSGIEEIDIASYSRWLNPALDKIRWYLMITPKEANNFAGRLNSKH